MGLALEAHRVYPCPARHGPVVAAVNHDEIVTEIQARARAKGVLSHYCGRSQQCDGDRGLPDLFLVGVHGSAWVEVKTPSSPSMSPAQVQWAYQLRAAGQVHYIVQGAALDNGAVDAILGVLAGPEPNKIPLVR
jgi:hypothetical protein